MARFNNSKTATAAKLKARVAPIQSALVAGALTGNHAPGSVRDPQSELFLLGVANFVTQDRHYEAAAARDQRYIDLIRRVAVEEPEWMQRFLPWLRGSASMRTASIIGAVEAAKAMASAGITGGRQMLAASLQRADEPGEALAYHKTAFGKFPTGPVQRGIADAVARLYNERSAIKYDTSSDKVPFRFGDVLELTHPKPRNPFQTALFPYLITVAKKRDNIVIPDSLPVLIANAALRKGAAKTPELLLNSARLGVAGMTWEAAQSLAGEHAAQLSKRQVWEAMIPNMNLGALIKNLRNFDEAGVSNDTALIVSTKLSTASEVRAARLMPMQVLAAYRAVPSDRWKWPLEQALQHCLANVPQFNGNTLILVDTSQSMDNPFSAGSELRLWDAATVFGLAVAARCEHADVVSFAGRCIVFPSVAGESLLKGVERWKQGGFFQGGGTATREALLHRYKKHDRVVILTDEQANRHNAPDVAAGIVPDNVQIITFNLDGYKHGHLASGTSKRVTIGGLSDAAFSLIPMLEQRGNGLWPF